MKTKRIFIIVGAIFFSVVSFAQEDWKPRIHFTGYLNSVVEYSDHADESAVKLPAEKHWGIGLAQVGFLATYKPLEKIEIKTTIVYSPWVRSWHDVLIEAYGKYRFNEKFNIGAGKFLTPLSPSNLSFYAPLNTSGVLPMVVSHHMFFPQSISGFQVAGAFGDDFKIDYNATYGNYYITDHIESGVLGIQGQEELWPFQGHYEVYEGNKPESYLGGSGRLAFNYQDFVNLGLNIFEGTESNLVVLDPATSEPSSFEPARQTSFGVDLHVNVKKIKLNTEYWMANAVTTKSATEYKMDYEGYYAELIYDGGQLKPWIRYEYIEDAQAVYTNGDFVNIPIVSYSGGIAYRPIYETIFKLEYRRVLIEDYQDTGLPSTDFQDYNYYLLSVVLSF